MYSAGSVLKINMGSYFHYGLADGLGNVIHNSKRNMQVTSESYEGFSNQREIELSEITSANPSYAVNMANRYLGMPYNLFASNCEQFVRMCYGHESESTQVQQYMIMALGAGMAIKGKNELTKAIGIASSVAALLTPAEESPYQNVLVASLIAVGVVALANK